MDEEELIVDPEGLISSTAFNAEIVSIEQVENKYGDSPRFDIGIRPMDFEIGGETHMFHEYLTYSPKKSSKWGRFMTAVYESGMHIRKLRNLIGFVFLFDRKVVDIGGNEVEMLLPIKFIGGAAFYKPKKSTDYHEETTNDETEIDDIDEFTEGIPDEPGQKILWNKLADGVTQPQLEALIKRYLGGIDPETWIKRMLMKGEIYEDRGIYHKTV